MSQVTNRLVLAAALSLAGLSTLAHAQNSIQPPLDNAAIQPLLSLDHAVSAVAAHVNPAVVNVAVTSKNREDEDGGPRGQQQGQDNPFFRFFGPGFGMGPQQRGPQIEHGIGSGFIISSDGYIVTNEHVIDGAVEITVTLHDRRQVPAKLIGSDKLTDLAVLKIEGHELPHLNWGDSTKLEPGQSVMAFGSPFGYFQFSVTRGIVSGLNRPNPFAEDRRKPGGFIQTDAAINRGNSGGPLVDAHGDVVGINTFIISDSGSSAGAGFAIPSQIAHRVAALIMTDGKVEHGYLGITITDVTPANAKFFALKEYRGALINQVTAGGPADKAGLKAGDVVQQIDGQRIELSSDLQEVTSTAKPGTVVKLELIRDGKPMTISATVGTMPDKDTVEEAAAPQQGAVLGVSLGNLSDDERSQLNLPASVTGAVVEEVRPGSPAEDAGIQQGDVIVEINRQHVANAEQASKLAHSLPAHEDVLLQVWSRGTMTYRVVHPAQDVK